MKKLIPLIIFLLILSGCSSSPWNSSGQLTNENGGRVINPQPIPVTGNVSATVTGANITFSVNVSAPNPLPVTGTVGVSSLPAITGTVAVSNFPATTNVSGSVSTNTTIDGIMGTDNVSHRINISSDGQFITNTETVFQEISMHGELETRLARSFHVMGRRAGFASTTALQDIKEFGASTNDTFPILTGIEALQVVSSSTSDTAAGTGARTVEVMYLDNSYNLLTSQQISLNGTSPVATNFTAKFIISMEVTSLGSSEVSQGNIVLETTAGSVIQEQITAGGNRSLSSHFMIPANYTGYLVSWGASSIVTTGAAQQQDMRIRATVDDEGNLSTVYHFLDNIFVASGMVTPQVDLPYIKLPALTKIKVSTISSSTATTTRADASYCLFIVHN